MPLLCVCIPAFNRAALLPALLDSIFQQDFADFDVVLAEDGSPERETIAQVVADYARRYPGKIHYYENAQTLGYDANLRRLLELAQARYVLFMGNDDLLAPGALAAVAGAVQGAQNVGVVLRSYASFETSPEVLRQSFRYFDTDRYFPPGADTAVTFFRRSVFISGMVVRREAALACATAQFDGSLLYQQHLVGQILARESGVYLHQILAYHRLGGTPDFGVSAAERDKFVPREQTPESSVHFMRGMLAIARSLDAAYGAHAVSARIIQDIGNYSYPILSIQAKRPVRVFVRYLRHIARLGLWRVPLFYVYALGLLVLGRTNCDRCIALIKRLKGRAPMLGKVYAGQSNNKAN